MLCRPDTYCDMNFAAYWVYLLASVVLHCQRIQAQTTSVWDNPRSDFSCDFGFTCDISQDRNDDFNWLRNYYSYVPPTWTSIDDNMYINEDNKRPGSLARFKTPVVSSSYKWPSLYCIEFSYIIMGPYVGQLEVIIESESDGIGDPIWSSSGLQGPYWNTEYIDYQTRDAFRVIFKATVGSISYKSYIGIDDLEIYSGVCGSTPFPTQSTVLSEINCDFESNSDLCGFTSMERSRWRYTRAGSLSYSYPLPNEDHTLNRESGHYMYSSYDEAVLYSPLLTSSGSEACFSFWYYLQARSTGKLLIYLQSLNGHIGDPLAVTSSLGHGDGQWQLQQVPLRATEPATFYIVLIFRRRYYDNRIGVDDFLYKQSPCSRQFEDTHSGNCNFEQSLDECGYIQGGTNEDDFDWNLAQGLMADETRPNADHSFGNSSGHYVYIQSSFPVAGNTAKLFTPKLTSTKSPRCLTFWYYIDQNVGELEVYLEILDAVDKVWYSKTPTGNQWKLATVDIVPISSDFTIMFQGTVGESYYRGAIAIDDIILDDCESVVNHISQFSCNFENDIAGCGLFQRYDDDLDWLYFNNYGVHGLSDSSTYMYVEGGKEDKACIQTPPINYNGSILVSFSVHMNFDPELNLRVFIQEGWNYDKKKLIWEKNGTTQGWEQVNVMEVNQTNKLFAILFEGVLGPSSLGVIAVDDINIYPDKNDIPAPDDDKKSNAIIITATVVPLVVIIAIVIILIIFKKQPWMNKPKDIPKTKSTKNFASDAYADYQEDIYENAYTPPL